MTGQSYGQSNNDQMANDGGNVLIVAGIVFLLMVGAGSFFLGKHLISLIF